MHKVQFIQSSRPVFLKNISEKQIKKKNKFKVLLVAMPFVSAFRPSIQIGLLSSIAKNNHYSSKTLHANLDLASAIGLKEYEALCAQRLRALGDWLYSISAFGESAPDSDGLMLTRFDADLPTELNNHKTLLNIRNKIIPEHLERLSKNICSERWDVVGFTSTFQQNVASFALAKLIKLHSPNTITLFGGANFEGDMGKEYVRSIDCIDYAISGEADIAFVSFLDALVNKEDPSEVAGVLSKKGKRVIGNESNPFDQMDDLPIPDYDEYFEKVSELGITSSKSRRGVYLPFESSRGCWWGAKKHCTFCGLNGQTMGYRAKSASKVFSEIVELNHKYRSYHFEAVDNILEPDYLKKLFPPIAKTGLSYKFFFEVKSNLSRQQIKTLSEGGVERIQPGIESLNSRVLSMMDKGVTAAVNVNLLRWCSYYGIDVGWNLLWGFPGETEADYLVQAELFNNLHHLMPPNGGGRVWLERFSPMYRDTKRFPVKWKKPEASYGFVYPKSVNLDKSAYFFEYEFEQHPPGKYFVALKKAINCWQSVAANDPKPKLTLWNSLNMLQVEDSRDVDNIVTHTWQEPLASIYRGCMEKPISVHRLCTKLSLKGEKSQVNDVLDEFVERKVMMKDGNLYLALALPVKRTGAL